MQCVFIVTGAKNLKVNKSCQNDPREKGQTRYKNIFLCLKKMSKDMESFNTFYVISRYSLPSQQLGFTVTRMLTYTFKIFHR